MCPQTHPYVDQLVSYALKYYHDIVAPAKVYRKPELHEKEHLQRLAQAIKEAMAQATPEHPLTPETWQHLVYETGKANAFPDTKSWFSFLYQTLLGQDSGPRMGTFIALYGPENMYDLIQKTCQA